MGTQNPERNPGSVGDSNFQLQQENANRPQIQPDSQTAFEFPIARPDAWEATRGNPANSPGEDSIDNRSPSFGEAPTRFDFTRGSIGNSGRDRSADVQFESNSGPDHSISGPFPHESEPEFSKDPAPQEHLALVNSADSDIARNTTPAYNRSGAIQIHNRYLIAESDEGVEIIDQHALHERILYEQLREKILAGKLETQRLLVPEPVQLSPSECAAALEAKDEFAEIGVEIEAFGGDTVLITGYPAMLANHSPAELLRQMIEQCIAGTTPERRDTIDSLMHMISCKAAIKAGDKLTPEEVTVLLENRDLCRDSHHCPHGRPTALIFSREELDRRFKRI
jgi:DNA mismatch repair ATPase MutL